MPLTPFPPNEILLFSLGEFPLYPHPLGRSTPVSFFFSLSFHLFFSILHAPLKPLGVFVLLMNFYPRMSFFGTFSSRPPECFSFAFCSAASVFSVYVPLSPDLTSFLLLSTKFGPFPFLFVFTPFSPLVFPLFSRLFFPTFFLTPPPLKYWL